MKRITIINHKGGPGKTTTTVNLAGALASMDYRVLVIDVDGQGDVSSVLLDHHENLAVTVADLFNDSGRLLGDIIQPTKYENIFIAPADDRLNEVDATHSFETDPRATALLDAIGDLQERFDYVLMDCAGKVHLTGFAAIVAADELVVPVETSRFAVRNLATVHREYCSVQQSFNPDISIRFFLSKVDARDPSVEVTRKSLEKAFGRERVMRTEIPYARTFKTAITLGKPITVHSKRSKAAIQTVALAKEVTGVQDDNTAHADKAAA